KGSDETASMVPAAGPIGRSGRAGRAASISGGIVLPPTPWTPAGTRVAFAGKTPSAGPPGWPPPRGGTGWAAAGYSEVTGDADAPTSTATTTARELEREKAPVKGH